jgi:xanthine/uracil permease
MPARTSPRSILAWRPRPMTRALIRSALFRVSGVITVHYAIVRDFHEHVLIGLLWGFAALTIFVSAALNYQAVRLERRYLLDSAEAYLDMCDAAPASAD